MSFARLTSFFLGFLLLSFLPLPVEAQLWSGIITAPRATTWAGAAGTGGIPSGSWTQCGSTIAAYGSSGSYASPATINNALAHTSGGYTGCGANTYVLLGSGDFYLTDSLEILLSSEVLRGAGANQTRIHFNNESTGCNGIPSVVCVAGALAYAGFCNVDQWPCPSGQYTSGYGATADWTAGYSQGTTSITLSNVTGITLNKTPIVLDQCDTGFTGTSGQENCTATSGVITAASIWSGGGGSGYANGDNGTINCGSQFGRCYGSGTATYHVTSTSGGAVTAFTITNGGSGYTFTNTNGFFGGPQTTTHTSGSGTGFEVNITAVTSYDNSAFFDCAITMICANESDSGTARDARSKSEVHVATAISGSGPFTVTISPAIVNPNFASGQSPQAWWTAGSTSTSGVENLGIDMTPISGGAAGVGLNNCYHCWVKGIASDTANNFHVDALVTFGQEVRDSYFYWTTNAGTTSYGIGSAGQVGFGLFENNIIQGVVDPLNNNATCTGCVYDYNFSVNDYYAETGTYDLLASSPMHSASTSFTLEEGNIGSALNLDNIHGPHPMNTFYRNYWNGHQPNNGNQTTRQTIPVFAGFGSRYNNIVANVLGDTPYHAFYQCVPTSSSQTNCTVDPTGATDIYQLGWSGAEAQLDFNNTPALPNDLIVGTSLLRWANYDTVTAASRFCGNSSDTGWSTTCGSTSEVPTGDANYPNSLPTVGDTTAGQSALPASFVYSSRPLWWGAIPWPAIGPDVSTGNILECTSGTYIYSLVVSTGQCSGGTHSPAVALHAAAIPAMNCYLNTMSGPPDGTGAFLSFNAASCYTISSGQPTVATGKATVSGKVTVH